MNQQNIKNPNDSNTSSDAGSSFQELVKEMKLLGMDPKPLLEIAATDIFTQHGTMGMTYAELMLDQMIEENNPNGIALWKELYHILSDLISAPKITLH